MFVRTFRSALLGTCFAGAAALQAAEPQLHYVTPTAPPNRATAQAGFVTRAVSIPAPAVMNPSAAAPMTTPQSLPAPMVTTQTVMPSDQPTTAGTAPAAWNVMQPHPGMPVAGPHEVVVPGFDAAAACGCTSGSDFPWMGGGMCQCAATGTDCGCQRETWLDTFEFFGGIDGSKQPQDFGVNANFGGRFSVNWALPVIRKWGVGIQAGTAINFSDNAVQVFELVGEEGDRSQSFTTVGVFQRTDRITWAIGYDFLKQDYYDTYSLGQWRGRFGVLVRPKDELGIRAAISDHGDRGTFGGGLGPLAVDLDPLNQGSLFWKHTWDSGAATSLWMGVAEGHAEPNVVLGDLPDTSERLVWGVDVHAPLNRHVALFGEANFVGPADTGTVDAYLGLVFYPGGLPGTRRFAPVLPVANNTSMTVDLNR